MGHLDEHRAWLHAVPITRNHVAFLLYRSVIYRECSILADTCRKLLTRNTFAVPQGTGSGKDKIAHTRADILNLISSDTSALSEVAFTVISLFRAQIEMLIGCTYVWYLLGEPVCMTLQGLLLTKHR